MGISIYIAMYIYIYVLSMGFQENGVSLGPASVKRQDGISIQVWIPGPSSCKRFFGQSLVDVRFSFPQVTCGNEH